LNFYQTGLRIANGRVCDDDGAYTYGSSIGCSVVDYCIVSECLLPLLSHFVTHRHNILSDHCIIEFSLISNVSLSHNASMETKTNHSKTFRYK